MKIDQLVTDADPRTVALRRFSSESLFLEYTILGTEDKDRMIRIFFERGQVPDFSFDPEINSWIFHAYFDHGNFYTKECHKMFRNKQETTEQKEKQIETEICHQLSERGIAYERQLQCSAGIIDILTPSYIIEVKAELTRTSIFHAIGQLRLYSQCVAGKRRKKIVGVAAGEQRLYSIARKSGVEVEVWRPEWKTNKQ